MPTSIRAKVAGSGTTCCAWNPGRSLRSSANAKKREGLPAAKSLSLVTKSRWRPSARSGPMASPSSFSGKEAPANPYAGFRRSSNGVFVTGVMPAGMPVVGRPLKGVVPRLLISVAPRRLIRNSCLNRAALLRCRLVPKQETENRSQRGSR